VIDDLATRVGMSVAAFLLLATGLSVVSLSSDSATLESTRVLARHVARELDAIGRLNLEMSLLFGPDKDAGVPMPADIGGRPYRLEVRAADVRVIAEGVLAVESLRVRVHLFAPDRSVYSADELQRLDDGVLSLASGEPFLALRTERLVDGESRFLTFAVAG
jgi:hypothetical protein